MSIDAPTAYNPLPLIQASRATFDGLVAGLDEATLTTPGVEGEWSIKDILAHLAAWEARLTVWLTAVPRGEWAARPEPGITWDAMDSLNEQTYLANRNLPLVTVLRQAAETHSRTLQTLQACLRRLSPADFEQGSGPDGKEAPLKFQIAANTYEHYDEHAANIQTWLATRRG